jgi:hypothetical protein
MKKIKILDVVFTNEIEGYEIEAFRGAISKLVGFENTLYHNHINDTKLAYSYPLIQYKIIKRQASFSFIAQGVEEAKAFFTNKDWNINISGRSMKLEIDTFNLKNAFFKVENEVYKYKIRKWMPLNQENFKKYIQLKSVEERIDLLTSILIGNILSMAKSLDWKITNQIDLSIDEVIDEQKITFKKNSVITFDLCFISNVQLPTNIGLGKGVSHGFGILETKYKI